MSDKAKRITMVELARLAAVDISTVSRALNDSPLVKQGTKDHVLKIAAETGYVVNASARNLRRQSSQAIGLVIPLHPDSGQTISDPFFLEMVGAVSHAASQKGYDLIVSVPQSEEQIAERRLLQMGRADGLIVIGQAGRAERLNALGDVSRNIVVWGGRHGQTNYTLVGSDNVEGGRIATEHLLSLGRRRILFLGDTDLPEVALRYDGLKQACESHGQSPDPALVLKLSFGGDAAFNEVVRFRSSGPTFDAIFAASDVLAISAIQALVSLGVKVPEDVSVVGYDGIGQAALATPSLTTIDQNISAGGAIMVDLLLRKIAALTTIDQNISAGGAIMVDLLLRKIAGETVESATTSTRLIIRKSCGG